MRELISVICTVRNGERTISETINSVLNQTYDYWEMIIVDDGSTDDTNAIIKEYIKKENKIKLFFSGGVGRAKSLNKAIEFAKGNYIANIDADDLMHPRKLEYQIHALNEKKSFFLVSTDSILIYEEELPNWKEFNYEKHNFKLIDKKLLIKNQINHSSVLMKKKIIIELGGYNEDRKTQLDYELWLRAFLKNKEMLKLNMELTAKRIHENQSFENKSRLRYTYKSSILKLKFVLKSRKYAYLFPLPIISFILSQLPFKLRRVISRKVLREK